MDTVRSMGSAPGPVISQIADGRARPRCWQTPVARGLELADDWRLSGRSVLRPWPSTRCLMPFFSISTRVARTRAGGRRCWTGYAVKSAPCPPWCSASNSMARGRFPIGPPTIRASTWPRTAARCRTPATRGSIPGACAAWPRGPAASPPTTNCSCPGRRPSAIGCTRNCAVPDWGDSWERWRRWGQPLCCPGAASRPAR